MGDIRLGYVIRSGLYEGTQMFALFRDRITLVCRTEIREHIGLVLLFHNSHRHTHTERERERESHTYIL